LLHLLTMALAAGADHENTTTEGSIARHSFGKGALRPGKVIKARAAVIVSDNNSTDTLVIGVRFGKSTTVTSNTAAATSSAIDVADGDVAIADVTIDVQTDQRAVITTLLSEPDATGTISLKAHAVVYTLTGDEKFSNTAHYLDVTADWSVAHADNETAAESWHVYEIV
jgi:hypothetical protein